MRKFDHGVTFVWNVSKESGGGERSELCLGDNDHGVACGGRVKEN